MSYSATVYNVMIASPGDVQPERKIVRDVIHEWNDIHSESRRVRLAPIGWDTHSSPEMGGHPQEIINRKVLNRCDLLVAIFWTRIGTPTRAHASGTVEEIEEHLKTGKPAMLYFSKRPVELDSVDREQYDQVLAFKTSCKERGMYREYLELDDFLRQFYRHLQIILNDTEYFPEQEELDRDDSALRLRRERIPSPLYSDGVELPPKAMELLLEARQDKSGTIMILRHLGGTALQTNGKDFLAGVTERRVIAEWEAALELLINEEMVVERGYKGEIFEVTSRGYALADYLAEGPST